MPSGSSMTLTIAGSPEESARSSAGASSAGSLDVLGVAAEHVADTLVAARREAGRDLRVRAVHPDLRYPDLAPCAVVPDHQDGRDVEADERVEVEPVETEGAVAHHAHDRAAETGRADPDRVAGPDAETPERSRIEPVAGPVDAQDARHGGNDVPAVPDHHRARARAHDRARRRGGSDGSARRRTRSPRDARPTTRPPRRGAARAKPRRRRACARRRPQAPPNAAAQSPTSATSGTRLRPSSRASPWTWISFPCPNRP